MRQRRVFFYVQHLLGIGHLARASRIASALAADGFDVTVVTGGTAVPGFPSADLKHVALPRLLPATRGSPAWRTKPEIRSMMTSRTAGGRCCLTLFAPATRMS